MGLSCTSTADSFPCSEACQVAPQMHEALTSNVIQWLTLAAQIGMLVDKNGAFARLLGVDLNSPEEEKGPYQQR